jgi:glutamate 5-kinase
MTSGKKLRITLKVGSNVITNDQGFPDLAVITSISEQIKHLRARGHEVLLVSSGAVAAGRSLYPIKKGVDPILQRQVLASIGQVELISLYKSVFGTLGLLCAQVLVTREDFKDRHHYLNMQNCLSGLLSHHIVPIINENDVVSVTELMFTDNDELAGLISAMMNTDILIILTNVDGIYDGDPAQEGTKILHHFDSKIIDLNALMSARKSGFGRGGIITKCQTAEKISGVGIPVHIANGRTENVIQQILDGKEIGTRFSPKRIASSFKKYMAHAYEAPKGKVVVNVGARDVLLSTRATSLLPVGLVKVVGKFKKGDIIRIFDEGDKEIGLGLARYGYKKARSVVGQKNQKPIIHYDHLYLY